MPFNQKETYTKFKNHDEVSAKETKKIKENNELIELLKKYNFIDDTFFKISSYLKQNLDKAISEKNKSFQEYFKQQQNTLEKFRSLLVDINKLKLKLQKESTPKIRMGLSQQIEYLEKLLKDYAKKYQKNKEKIKSKMNFIDNGPFLTEKGLVFPETNESEC